ncbi:hypothetical protein SFRURICE_007602 [Spodoptera frugiperda]|nr:hypothetical protein SFRURICE_007602 [Spodoptera frugiperda]
MASKGSSPSDYHIWGPVGLMPDPELRTTQQVYRDSGSKSRSRNRVSRGYYIIIKSILVYPPKK